MVIVMPEASAFVGPIGRAQWCWSISLAGALALAEKAAAFNKLAQCRFVKADVMAELEKQAAAGEKYDVVIVDPPAFIKAKKDIAAGLKGYRKLTALRRRWWLPAAPSPSSPAVITPSQPLGRRK